MKKKYFGTDGIRGTVGEGNITPEFVMKLGWAVGKMLGGDGLVLIGKDTRISGYMFESALEAGLVAAGVDVGLLGPIPTPGVSYLTRTLRAKIGIVISASHNSFEDNGIKFFSENGTKLSDTVEFVIEEMLDQPMTVVSSDSLGKVERIESARGRYIEFCKSTIPSMMNFNNLKVVLDCSHGATYQIAPNVFHEIGADVVDVIGVNPNGLNINSRCGSTNIQFLQERVQANNADIGIAFDGDGDRVIMVDADGKIVDGDQILYIIAVSRYRTGKLQGPVVGTSMTNMGIEKALEYIGIPIVYSLVGDRHVMEKLKYENGVIGGESSGHIICLDRSPTGDGIISALQVIAEMNDRNKSLNDLLQNVYLNPTQLNNVRLTNMDNVVEVLTAKMVTQAINRAENDLSTNGRVSVRISGTEPLIRVLVEGEKYLNVCFHADNISNAIKEAALKMEA